MVRRTRTKQQSHNAPVSQSAAFKYSTSLNALLDGPKRDKHRILIADATVAFWTDKPTIVEDIFAQFASEGSGALDADAVQDEGLRKKIESFLLALREGKEAYSDVAKEPDRTLFHLLAISPNAARLSIRFYFQGAVTHLLENLRRHYEDIRISPQLAKGKRKGDPEYPPTWLLLRQTARESKDIPPILSGPLLRAIVAGTKYPPGLFSSVMRRINADRTVNYARCCVIKGHLVRNLGQEVPMSLDKEREDRAYRLGRLFAALDKTQTDGIGKVNVTVRDRFYSSASATPQSVFPRLLRTYQHHLSKLEGGLKVDREKLVQEILSPIEDFPAHLSLSEQGRFALGYYHQTQHFYTKKQQTSEERTN